MRIDTRMIDDVHSASITIVVTEQFDVSPANILLDVASMIVDVIKNNDDCIRAGIKVNVSSGYEAGKDRYFDRTITLSSCTAGGDTVHNKLWHDAFIHIVRKTMEKLKVTKPAIAIIDGTGVYFRTVRQPNES